MKYIFPLILLVSLASSCKKEPAQSQVSVARSQSEEPVPDPGTEPCDLFVPQGMEGKLIFLEGDQMPGPDKPANEGNPVQREVWVFPPVTMQELYQQDNGPFFYAGDQKPLVTQLSGEDGCFRIGLAPGTYSLLVMEPEKGLFGNIFSGNGIINPVVVEEGKLTQADVKIDYLAAY